MAGVQASARLPDLKSGITSQHSTKQRLHPRRTPPRDSKIVRGSKKLKLSHSSDENEDQISPAAHLKSHGSGSDQSANRWFERVNQHVPHSAQGNTEYDDEPPFFMSHQNNYHPGTFAPSEGSRLFGVQSRLDSENEELRGVIDDLTIENKRLKQILRTNNRSQRGSPSTEGQDRLFEVRMHGLPSDKRRELEFLLKNFATSVHTSAPSISNSVAGSGASSESITANNKSKTDSGYASNSNSGQPSAFHNNINNRVVPGVSQSAREKNIKSYLHDIPDTLLPRQQPMVMSERSKMALVVRRMEQLFTGKQAAPGEHSQPLQQQEVSQMAARADAQNSRKRKIEGTREAHILPPDTKVNLDAIEAATTEKRKRVDLKTVETDASNSETLGASISRPDSPDQRPTRPLDLDIHRAQVAAENIQYIRHLGLSPQAEQSSETNHAWVYLNLLTNMAQLHTINVTPDFVRRAIKKLSTKFELSKDGYKVRWIGGSQGTVFSKEEEKALEAAYKDSHSPDDSTEDSGTGGSSSKRSKTNSTSNPVVSTSTPSEDKTSGLQPSRASRALASPNAAFNLPSWQTKQAQSGSAFDYKPIVYRDRSRDATIEDSYLQDSESSPGDTSRDSSGLVQALSRSNLNQQRTSDEGLITFYTNPFFCSDYSGDKMPNNMLPPRASVPGYLLGGHPCDDFDEHSSRLADACYFTPQFGPAPFRAPKDEKLPSLDLVPISSKCQEEIRPLEFVASGIGGVTPDDNIAIDVDVHMVKASEKQKEDLKQAVPFTGTEVKPEWAYECGPTNKLQLLPSRLPPPNYVFFGSSSSSGNQLDDDDDDSEASDESSTSGDEAQPPPPSFLQHLESARFGQMEMDDHDDRDDSSMDMLAVARAADPVQIAEQERQYLINQPMGRAVAGSLAATVGASRSSSSVQSICSDRAEYVSQDDDDDNDDDDDDEESGMDVDDE